MRRRTERAVPPRPEGVILWSIILVSTLVYLRSIGYEFTFDDWAIVARNPAVQAWAGWKNLLASPYWLGSTRGMYRPITVLSFALERLVHGGGPAGFHLVNVVLHAAVSVLVYRVALHVLQSRWAAALAGLLFAAHPIHIEAVAGIVGRAELLSCGFALATALVWMRHSDGSSHSRGIPGLVVLFALAVASKEHVIVLPAVLVLWELARDTSDGPAARIKKLARDRRLWALAASGAGSLALRVAVLGGAAQSFVSRPLFVENPLAHQTASVRIVNAAANQVYAAFLQLVPYRLLPDYSYSTLPLRLSWHDPMCLTAVALLAGAVLLWFARDRTARRLAFASAWYVTAVTPTSNVFFAIGTIFGERTLYFPSAAFCIGIAAVAERVCVRFLPGIAERSSPIPKAALAALLLPALALSAVTSVHLPDWRSDLSLFGSAAASAPENVKVRLWLGDAFVRAGDSASAIREYRRALEIRPEYGAASANLLVPLMNLHRYPEAIEAGETARRLFTEDNAVLLMNLATAYQAVGEQVRFLECIQRALELNPEAAAPTTSSGGTTCRRGTGTRPWNTCASRSGSSPIPPSLRSYAN